MNICRIKNPDIKHKEINLFQHTKRTQSLSLSQAVFRYVYFSWSSCSRQRDIESNFDHFQTCYDSDSDEDSMHENSITFNPSLFHTP